jgi:hypothetical protein
MTEFDLDRLGDVWRQQPDPAELDSLRRAADDMQRRARRAQLFDIFSTIVVAGVVLFLVWSNPQRNTFVVGAAAILLLLFGQQRQRRLREAELKGLTGTSEDMLEQSVARIEATIRRTRFSLFALPAAVLFGIAFSYLTDVSPGGQFLPSLGADSWLSTLVKIAVGLFVLFATAHFYRSMRRERGELERLSRLRDVYRQEREASAGE